jgi:hypothetical protein
MFHTKVVEKIQTHFMSKKLFFENRGVYEIMCKNTVDLDRPQKTKWRMHIACCIPTTTNTHLE